MLACRTTLLEKTGLKHLTWIALIWLCSLEIGPAHAFSTLTWTSTFRHVLEHVLSPPLEFTPLDSIANTRIPIPEEDAELLMFVTKPSKSPQNPEKKLPVLILIHEFFGLTTSIQEKAVGLADDLGCIVVAPDTFRGTSTDFIPKAIWLALTTPQDRVNKDLDMVCDYLSSATALSGQVETSKIAVMGFCYGGGKAIKYTTESRPNAATVVFYGNPVTDVEALAGLEAPVCGIYGRNDVQFPMPLLDKFQAALVEAQVENDVRIYDDVGHAFWSDMDQIRRGDEPQLSAYNQCTTFLRSFFDSENTSS